MPKRLVDTHRHVIVSQHREEVLVTVVFHQVGLTRLEKWRGRDGERLRRGTKEERARQWEVERAKETERRRERRMSRVAFVYRNISEKPMATFPSISADTRAAIGSISSFLSWLVYRNATRILMMCERTCFASVARKSVGVSLKTDQCTTAN